MNGIFGRNVAFSTLYETREKIEKYHSQICVIKTFVLPLRR